MHLFQAQAVSCYQSNTIDIFACIEYKFMARSPLKYVVLFNFPIVQSFKRVNKGRMVAQVCFINNKFSKMYSKYKILLKNCEKNNFYKCIVQFIFPFIFCFFLIEKNFYQVQIHMYILVQFLYSKSTPNLSTCKSHCLLMMGEYINKTYLCMFL